MDIMVRRVKATIAQLDATRRTRGAKDAMYAKMVDACIEAIILRETDILITFPYFIRFTDKTFPRGMLVSKTATTNVYKIKVKKLMNWLHKKSYTPFDTDAIMQATSNLNRSINKLVRALDEDILEENLDDND